MFILIDNKLSTLSWVCFAHDSAGWLISPSSSQAMMLLTPVCPFSSRSHWWWGNEQAAWLYCLTVGTWRNVTFLQQNCPAQLSKVYFKVRIVTVSVNMRRYCILGLTVLMCLCEVLNSYETQLRRKLMISYGTPMMSSGFIWTKCCKILISLYNGVNIF